MQRLPAMLLVSILLTGCSEPESDSLIRIASPAGPGSAEPHLAVGPDGAAVLSWLEGQPEGFALRYATFNGTTWLPARTIAEGTNWFVNWADFPSVSPISETLWAAHWLVKRPGGSYAYDVALALSQDGGETWGAPLTPHSDGTRTEHGFVSLFPWQGGVGAVWLDGRNMTQDGHSPDHHAGGGMTLRSALVSASGEITRGNLIDDLVCDCCQTDVATTSNGPVVVYRNRTTAEIRDIYVARSVNGRWESAQPVADDGWEIGGCPVNGPAIEAHGNTVAIAWYTAANDHPRVRFARSTDAAASFSPALDIDAGQTLGRVDVALLEGGAAAVSWLRRGPDGQGEIVVQRVARNGELGPQIVIAKTAIARPSGFPQMVKVEAGLLFAWTHSTENGSTVRTARLESAVLSEDSQSF